MLILPEAFVTAVWIALPIAPPLTMTLALVLLPPARSGMETVAAAAVVVTAAPLPLLALPPFLTFPSVAAAAAGAVEEVGLLRGKKRSSCKE